VKNLISLVLSPNMSLEYCIVGDAVWNAEVKEVEDILTNIFSSLHFTS
jgi:hypothetical protein